MHHRSYTFFMLFIMALSPSFVFCASAQTNTTLFLLGLLEGHTACVKDLHDQFQKHIDASPDSDPSTSPVLNRRQQQLYVGLAPLKRAIAEAKSEIIRLERNSETNQPTINKLKEALNDASERVTIVTKTLDEYRPDPRAPMPSPSMYNRDRALRETDKALTASRKAFSLYTPADDSPTLAHLRAMSEAALAAQRALQGPPDPCSLSNSGTNHESTTDDEDATASSSETPYAPFPCTTETPESPTPSEYQPAAPPHTPAPPYASTAEVLRYVARP